MLCLPFLLVSCRLGGGGVGEVWGWGSCYSRKADISGRTGFKHTTALLSGNVYIVLCQFQLHPAYHRHYGLSGYIAKREKNLSKVLTGRHYGYFKLSARGNELFELAQFNMKYKCELEPNKNQIHK